MANRTLHHQSHEQRRASIESSCSGMSPCHPENNPLPSWSQPLPSLPAAEVGTFKTGRALVVSWGIRTHNAPIFPLGGWVSPGTEPLIPAAIRSWRIHSHRIRAWRIQVALERAQVQAARPTSCRSVLQVRDKTRHTHRPNPEKPRTKRYDVLSVLYIVNNT